MGACLLGVPKTRENCIFDKGPLSPPYRKECPLATPSSISITPPPGVTNATFCFSQRVRRLHPTSVRD